MESQLDNLINKLCKSPCFKKMLLPSKKSYHLHTILTSCGHEHITDRSYLHHGLKRGNKSFASLQFTLRGWGELRYEHRSYRIDRGKLMIGIVPHNHKYYLPTNSKSWEFVYLTVAGSEAIRILKSIQEILGPVLEIHSINSLVIFEEILNLAYRNDGNIFLYSGLAYSFLLSLLSDMLHVEIQTTHPKINKALEICNQHYGNTIQIKSLATQLQISPYYFARLFHQEVGETFQKYLESLRIHKAMEKIVYSSASIKHVAHECGFSNSNYFGKVFRKYYGKSPTFFKKQVQS